MQWVSALVRPSRLPPRPGLDTQLTGARVMLRAGSAEDWKEWRRLRETSRNFLEPWEPKWPADALSYGYYCSLLRRHWRDWRGGRGYAFTIFMTGDGKPKLIGGITLNDIVYAAAQKGTLGYWIGEPYAGRGLMSEAVGLVCTFAFTRLKLQRVEAACLPHNEASKKVLSRNGFEEEGYAKEYLQINGKREDHLLWGRGRTLAV